MEVCWDVTNNTIVCTHSGISSFHFAAEEYWRDGVGPLLHYGIQILGRSWNSVFGRWRQRFQSAQTICETGRLELYTENWEIKYVTKSFSLMG